MYETKPYFYGTGRRKSSVARVRVYNGTGKITVNDRDIDDYFGLETLKLIVRQPLVLAEVDNKFDIVVRVAGGGVSGQAGAIRHGLSRALLQYDETLRTVLKKKGLNTAVGDEGGFAPNLRSNVEAVEAIMEAIEKAGYKPGLDVAIGLDVAASELYKDGKYVLEGEGVTYSGAEMVEYYEKLVKQFPVISIEDGLAEDDWDTWKLLTDWLMFTSS